MRVVVLVPEIAIEQIDPPFSCATSATRVVVMHNQLSQIEKRNNWCAYANGRIISYRCQSAVFT